MTSPLPPITGIDTHAHIFRRDLPLAVNRRYSPDYDALVEEYLAHLDRCGLSHGVLVQPSFLGTDNSFMLEAVRRHPARLRAIAVVDPDISDAELDELDGASVVGIRLNLVGLALEDCSHGRWQGFFQRLARRNWTVEIQRGMEDLGLIVPSILKSGVAVVIDHFGLPKGAIDPENPSHQAFLALMAEENVWIKLSATYRSKSTVEQAAAMLELLRKACGGSERFLWGSDWPHTQFEDQTNYVAQFSLINSLLSDPAERKKILVDNPSKLFKFA